MRVTASGSVRYNLRLIPDVLAEVTTDRRPRRVLMLAPEPFFEPRGTPFSEYHRIKALGELGHHVDLVTYPIGRDVALPNLTIFRAWRPPFVSKVRIGPSVTKVLLDGLMLLTICRRALDDEVRRHSLARRDGAGRGVAVATACAFRISTTCTRACRSSSSNFKYSRSSVLRGFEWAEDRMVHGSDVVITICQELQDTVEGMGVGDRALLIENVMGGDVEEPPSLGVAEVRRRWSIPADAPLVLYTGTFEAYQGVDLLIEASGHRWRVAPACARARRRRRTGAGRCGARAGRSGGRGGA